MQKLSGFQGRQIHFSDQPEERSKRHEKSLNMLRNRSVDPKFIRFFKKILKFFIGNLKLFVVIIIFFIERIRVFDVFGKRPKPALQLGKIGSYA